MELYGWLCPSTLFDFLSSVWSDSSRTDRDRLPLHSPVFLCQSGFYADFRVNLRNLLPVSDIYDVYNTLKNKEYKPGKLNVFEIYEPKKRRIVSQEMKDKLVNHLVARYILYPSILPCLIDENVASRKNMGTNKGIKLANKYRKICNIKYKRYYILKCDISKFFASIDNYKLKEKLKKRIKDKDALKIIFNIIDIEEAGLSIRLYDKPSTSHILFK